jgi:hypothetical protein
MKCSKCGSSRVAPAFVIDRPNHGELRAGVSGNPDGFFSQDTVYTDLYARICADCGAVEFIAADPEPLYAAYLRKKERES